MDNTKEGENQVIKVSAAISKVVVSAPTIKVRANLSYGYLQTAAYFSRMTYVVEKENIGRLPEESFLMPYNAYSISAVILSVTALEAKINEFFTDAVDKNPHTFVGLDPNIPETLAVAWPFFKSKENFLDKYNFALGIAGKGKIDNGKLPGQNVTKLNKLRNMLIHFKPEWSSEEVEFKTIENQLTGCFALNPFYKDLNTPWFPSKCLGHGCAEWAVKTSIEFIEEFFSLLGQSDYFKDWKHSFSTK